MSLPKIKVSQMSVAVTLNADDLLLIVQDGVNKQSSITNFLKNLNSVDSIRINPVQNAIDFSIASKNDANAIVIKGQTDRIGFGTATPESKVHVNGNFQVGSSSADGVMLQSVESITYTAADDTALLTKELSSSRTSSILTCDIGVVGKFSLSAGSTGQIKNITLTTNNTVTITLVGLGFNTVTLNAIGESVVLQYIPSISKWCTIGGNGEVLSTV